MSSRPHWLNSGPLPLFEPIDRSLEADVVVVGGGVTGITTAYLLKQSGASVVLLERGRCAGADTGHTTAHLTMVTDLRLSELSKRFGDDVARATWDAGRDAIEQIAALVEEQDIACEFIRVPGYLHAPVGGSLDGEPAALEQDARLARRLGFEAELIEAVPRLNRPGIRFAEQAKFHPRKYLAGLLRALPGNGCRVFEQSEAEDFEEDPLTVRVRGHQVRCRYLVLATHTPLTGIAATLRALALQTKLSLQTSYVLGARLPQDSLPEALYWDTSDPYYYLRIDRHGNHDYAIFGGKDSKTGQEADPRRQFVGLEAALHTWLPGARRDRHWLGQVIETSDMLPLIGETAESQFVATGFAGNGWTFGTLAAMMARDRFLGLGNPWEELFDVRRKQLAGGWRYLRENLDFPYHFVKDRLTPVEAESPETLATGEGRLLRLEGRRVAAYRDPRGELHLLSPVCTHLKCLVRWNGADRTWDCPCHGSRFHPTGEVLSGPAEQPLEELEAAHPLPTGSR